MMRGVFFGPLQNPSSRSTCFGKARQVASLCVVLSCLVNDSKILRLPPLFNLFFLIIYYFMDGHLAKSSDTQGPIQQFQKNVKSIL